MSFWLVFSSGVFVGFFLGMSLMCLLIIAKEVRSERKARDAHDADMYYFEL